jgi:hypothetical protein
MRVYDSTPDDLLLSIGGVVGMLSVRGASEFAREARARYDAFALPEGPSVRRAFSLRLDIVDGAGPKPDLPLSVNATASRLDIERRDFRVQLTLVEDAEGERWQGRGACAGKPWSFANLLRSLWSIFLPRAGGALFHACGLRLRDVGVLAPGPSGAGKTTLARKMEDPDDVLSDEIVAVHRAPDGQWRVSGTPFFGDFGRGGKSLRSWPLGAVTFLEKTSALTATLLEPAEAVSRALGCLLCFQSDAATAEHHLKLVTALCSEVPVVALGSRADTSVASMRDAIAPLLRAAQVGIGGMGMPAPLSPREMISDLRAALKKHRHYAVKPTGLSMGPKLASADALFIESVDTEAVRPGDLVVYWRVGATPEEDSLICHRIVGRLPTRDGMSVYLKGDALGFVERFGPRSAFEILGRVRAIHRDGVTHAVPGQVGNLAILASSLLKMAVTNLGWRR